MLCYARNKRSNFLQRINGQFAFASNVSKQCIESLHQMGIIVPYESIRHGLIVNANAVMDEIVNKTHSRHFFILYDNMNFYESIRD